MEVTEDHRQVGSEPGSLVAGVSLDPAVTQRSLDKPGGWHPAFPYHGLMQLGQPRGP